MTKLLYTRKQAATALAMSERQLDVLVARGDLAALRDGRLIKFTADELQRYIKQLPAHEPGAEL
ncbi:hypothetical protein DSM43518_04832 [Mycobacterium marinum]|uniref:excisionase family DNA-binding protein n=1 Tax=Mycobacterium marinum TaxID=1781 RepID=UPI000CD83A6C|nr:excisionase family DNA-binding protein [Mycobacterium marinum]AXN51290.1 hypothetical protein CCUG20998_03894 [Mycobacterium marinum]RFZ02845.1 hypothetical protein DSM43518_04832 [Mycobacterium marinum]RFZ26036.1 hypothetical protein DSM43519_01350 [Mycobacterium marinum]RFZ28915.1 hypothetical protein DSM44344_01182 [Mycobacterium marinum]RFZ39101.1 hypothetical protein NCTC2275_00369 [Mycobacterium marinum]